MSKVLLVAGEASGDLHAARVMAEMKELNNELEFIGIGGQRMAAAGMEVLFDPTSRSTIGFVEAIKHLPLLWGVLKDLEELIEREKPEVALLVDYSAFNLRVAKLTQQKGVPTVNYFAPSAWAWGKWRARKMARREAKIASVFPMEAEVYRQAGAEVNFVGHPLLDIVEPQLSKAEAAAEFGIDLDSEIIGLLPGSREQEIKGLLPPMLAAAELISAQREVQFLLPRAETVSQDLLTELIDESNLEIKVVEGHSYEVMNLAKLILVASGTATLEAACLGTPMLILYQTAFLTWCLAQLLVDVPYIGLPNLILEEEIVPEFLQKEIKAESIAQAGLQILSSPAKQAQIKEKLEQVVTELGAGGATKRVAEMVLDVGGVK